MTDRDFLVALFEEAVAAAHPERVIPPALPKPPRGRTVVVGAGKGVAQMAQAFEAQWNGPLSGLVVTRYGYSAPCTRIELREAAHPVPDKAGMEAAQAMLRAVSGLTGDDLVVALICGGGSALLPAPPPGCGLEDEIALNEILLASGAPIGVMNLIRKHFSQIKGGRLALACHPAPLYGLIISDIPGDDPALVASGPTLPSAGGLEDMHRALLRHGIALPAQILAAMTQAPMPGQDAFAAHRHSIVASAGKSLQAAADLARKHGLSAHILSDRIEGEAREVGAAHGDLAREIAEQNSPFSRPALLLSGGETSVTLKQAGRGGRNSEFGLSFAARIAGCANITALIADTDGIDGSEQNAGVHVDGDSFARMQGAGVDPLAALARHDSWGAFAAIDGLFHSGPTGTNVNDFRAILIR